MATDSTIEKILGATGVTLTASQTHGWQALTSSSSKKPVQSCSECRRRKIKCDRQIPCTPCLMRGDQSLCKEVKSERAVHPTLRQFLELAERVAFLEGELKMKSDGSVLRDISDCVTPVSEGVASMPLAPLVGGADIKPGLMLPPEMAPLPPSSSPPPRKKTKLSDAPLSTDDDEAVAMLLEDFAMGYRVNQDRVAASNLTSSANTSHQPTMKMESPTLNTSESSGQLSKGLKVLLDTTSTPFPSAEVTRILVDIYFSNIEWTMSCLHMGTYMDNLERFLKNNEDASDSWLCIHMMVLCLAYHYMGEPERQRLGLTYAHCEKRAQELFISSRNLLFVSDFLMNQSLEHLQCIVLQGGYQYDVDLAADAHWALVGSGIKIAQNLGFSRLPSSPKTLQQAVCSRTWWNLVYLDWSHAMSHGAVYCVQPEHITTPLPDNFDLSMLSPEALKREPRVEAPDLNTYSDSSFIIYRIKILHLYREVTDHLNANKGVAQFNFVLAMDQRLRDLIASLPPHFSKLEQAVEAGQRLNRRNLPRESAVILLTCNNRIMRLHRPFLAAGYSDETYSLSKDACISAAHNILSIYHHCSHLALDVVKYWLVSFYTFAAAVVVFIDLCHETIPEKQNGIRVILSNTIKIFSLTSATSSVSRNASVLLQSLLGAEGDIRGTRTKKNPKAPHDQESTIYKAVKQLVVGVHTNQMLSPSSNPPLMPVRPAGNMASLNPSHPSNPVAPFDMQYSPDSHRQLIMEQLYPYPQQSQVLQSPSMESSPAYGVLPTDVDWLNLPLGSSSEVSLFASSGVSGTGNLSLNLNFMDSAYTSPGINPNSPANGENGHNVNRSLMDNLFSGFTS